MAWTRSDWGYQWQGPYAYAAMGVTGAHPGDSDYKQVWSIRRWWSNTVGEVRITGTATSGSDGGDGVGVKVFLDGAEVYSEAVGGSGKTGSVHFDLAGQVRRGSAIDFVVTPGPAHDMNFDAVDFRAQVTRTAPVLQRQGVPSE